ncbi:L-gulono-1,4-lactone dehydrogenase-like [Glandiceps talaboti]
MGNSMTCVDCCCGLRRKNQCCWPCVNCCTLKKPFYNYDGSEIVEPMVANVRPRNKKVYKPFLKGMTLSMPERELGMDAPGQISAILKYAEENNLKARAVGTGSSWSGLISVRDILIDMENLDKVLGVERDEHDDSIYQVTVQGGKTVRALNSELDKRHNLAMPAMGNYDGQTAAGICSTSTHGSLIGAQTMSNFASGYHLIIAGGIQVKVRKPRPGEPDEPFDSVAQRVNNATYGDEPIIIVSTDIYRAVAVGLGSLGVIYSVTFDCRKLFNIREVRIPIKIDLPEQNEDFVLPDKVKNLYHEHGKFFSVFINMFPRNHCCSSSRYIRAVYLEGDEVEEDGCCQSDRCLNCQCCCCSGCRGQSACQFVQTDCSAVCMQSCAYCCPTCIPDIADCGLDIFSRKLPYIHKWYNVLRFTDGNIHIRTAEFCLPRDRLEIALEATIKLANYYADMHNMYTLLPTYVRFVEGDDLYLSPANRHRPDGSICDEYCYVEVPFLPGSYAMNEFHRALEDLLFEKCEARPHWSKNNFLNYNRVVELYPKLDEWKKVFLLFNRATTFDNHFTRYCGFDYFHREGQQTQRTNGVSTQQVVTSPPVSASKGPGEASALYPHPSAVNY